MTNDPIEVILEIGDMHEVEEGIKFGPTCLDFPNVLFDFEIEDKSKVLQMPKGFIIGLKNREIYVEFKTFMKGEGFTPNRIEVSIQETTY
jgi:hypothetical protein